MKDEDFSKGFDLPYITLLLGKCDSLSKKLMPFNYYLLLALKNIFLLESLNTLLLIL